MNKNNGNKMDACNKLIAGLENEIRIQDELIKSQKAMIKTLEEHNKKLTMLLDEVFNP